MTDSRAPPLSTFEADTRPLWVTMIFWTSARPRPVPFALVVKNGRNIVGTTAGSIPGPLSVTVTRSVFCVPSIMPATVTRGTDVRIPARLERVATEIAQGLAKQHFVPFDISVIAGDDHLTAARGHVSPDVVGGPLARSPACRPDRAPARWAWRSSGSS